MGDSKSSAEPGTTPPARRLTRPPACWASATPEGPRSTGWGAPGARAGQPLPQRSLAAIEYSFSGLKTALLYRLRDLGDAVTQQDRADLAAAFERSVVESLLEKLDAALSESTYPEVVVSGGVAANTLLRRRAAEVVGDRARLTMPPLELCTDNAAMIAAAAHHAVHVLGLQASTVDSSLGW